MTNLIQPPYTPQPRQQLLHETTARQILYGGSAGGGKQLSLNTPIPTPSGMVEIGRLRPGDWVLSPRGDPVQIDWVSEPEEAEAFAVEFDTGEVIEADARHLWHTMIDVERVRALRLSDEWRERRRGKRQSRAKEDTKFPGRQANATRLNKARTYEYKDAPTGAVRTTAEIAETLRVRGRANHSVSLTRPIELPDAILPIDPYLLGMWLGDGYSHTGMIGMGADDMEALLPLIDNGVVSDKTQTRNRKTPFRVVRFECLSARIGSLGLTRNKHIPQIYLRASKAQRLALLQGLCDTDGSCDRRGQVELGFSNQRLMEDSWELISSLGIKATIRHKKTRIGAHWRVKFVSPLDVFRLPRKLERQAAAKHRASTLRRYIVDVRPIGKRIMRCIQVAHPDGMYLVGRSFIATHNSYSLRWDAIRFCLDNPGCQAYLFRRTFDELSRNHINGPHGIVAECDGKFGKWNQTSYGFNFLNGSALYFCYCEKDSDVNRYQGAEMHWVGIDEAAHLTPYQIHYLKTRNRLGQWQPVKDRDRLPRFVMASNPGGPGHAYLKAIFLDKAPAETLFFDDEMRNPDRPDDKGWPSIFIPAKMADNKYLDEDYGASFGGLPPELARALREGDWDAVVGQALHTLSRERHMLRQFVPPRHWQHFMVIDWGSVSPFSVGWYVVSEGAGLGARENWPERWMPAGAVIRYAELYGWNGKPNQGARLSAQQVARKIVMAEENRNDPPMDYRVGDTEMWAQKGGPSIQEWFLQVDERLAMRRAEKDRKRNYQEVLARLAGNPRYVEDGSEEEDPMFFVTANCTHFWRTVPTLVLDETDPEKGPETKNQEDHVYDEVAYALRSRPYVVTADDRYYEQFGDEIRRARGKSADPYAT